MKKLLLFLFLASLFLSGCSDDYQTSAALIPSPSTSTVVTTTKVVKTPLKKETPDVNQKAKIATKTPELILETKIIAPESAPKLIDAVPDVPVLAPVVSVAEAPAPIAAPVYQPPTPAPAPALSNDNYYVNTAGSEVHSPANAPSVPAGASAVCGDGTYSFSQSRRGTCSHHGGVSEWLN
jgi:hypothetical protein